MPQVINEQIKEPNFFISGKLYNLLIEYNYMWMKLQLALSKSNEIQLALPKHKNY